MMKFWSMTSKGQLPEKGIRRKVTKFGTTTKTFQVEKDRKENENVQKAPKDREKVNSSLTSSTFLIQSYLHNISNNNNSDNLNSLSSQALPPPSQ